MDREPCPHRIVEDCGGAFMMGLIGGGIWNFGSGLKNYPMHHKLRGAINKCKSKAPGTGANFAAWGFTFSSVDCTLVYLRQKEDPWNSIASGGITGAILSARHGTGAMIGSACVGAFLLGVIEGMGIIFSSYTAQQFAPVSPLEQQAMEQEGAAAMPTTGGFFGSQNM